MELITKKIIKDNIITQDLIKLFTIKSMKN